MFWFGSMLVVTVLADGGACGAGADSIGGGSMLGFSMVAAPGGCVAGVGTFDSADGKETSSSSSSSRLMMVRWRLVDLLPVPMAPPLTLPVAELPKLLPKLLPLIPAPLLVLAGA